MFHPQISQISQIFHFFRRSAPGFLGKFCLRFY